MHFGPNLREFSGYSFNQCLNLNTFSIDENNQYFTVVNNFVFSKDMSRLVRTPIIFEEEDIPNKENITTFGVGFDSGATLHNFKGWENLSKIEDVGFHANHNLEIIDVSNTKITALPNLAFCDLDNLKTLILPAKLNELKFESITHIPKLYTLSLPSSINLIANQCFSYLNNLKVICYYGNVSFSGKNLFNNCPNVKYIRVCPLYPSEKFSSFNVSFDAFQLGETMITCSSIKNIPYSSTFPFISYSVFILI